jgi:photosystem II stability/assembly factor-like uncharacterized protein
MQSIGGDNMKSDWFQRERTLHYSRFSLKKLLRQRGFWARGVRPDTSGCGDSLRELATSRAVYGSAFERRCATFLAGIVALSCSSIFAQSLTWQPLYEPAVGGQVTSLEVSPHDSNLIVVGGDMLGIGRSSDGGANWLPAGTGLESWEISAFTFNYEWQNDIWVGTMHGPAKSEDYGRSWKPKTNGFPSYAWGKYTRPIQKILVDPDNPLHLLAFGGSKRWWGSNNCANFGAVYESFDNGQSWKLISRMDADKTGNEANVTHATYAGGSGTIIYASVSGYGVMRSDDEGNNWYARNEGLPGKDVRFIVAHPTDSGTLWCVIGGKGVYKTSDGGANWYSRNVGLETSDGSCIAVAASNPDVLYLTGAGHAIYRSSDGGAKWTKVASAPADNPYGWSMSFNWIAVDPANANRAYAGSNVSLYRTLNGTTWTDVSAYQPNGGTKWRGTGYSGLVCENFEWNPWDKNIAIAQAMDDGKLLVTRDSLFTWQVHHKNIGWYEAGTDVSFTGSSGNTIYAALGMQGEGISKNGIAKSVDGGLNWNMLPLPAGTDPRAYSVYADPGNANRVLAVFELDGGGQGLFLSTDGGSTWTRKQLVYPDPNGSYNDWSVMQVCGNTLRTSATVYYAVAYHGLYKSTDGGDIWTHVGGHWKGDWGFLKIFPDPANSNRLYEIVSQDNNSADGLWRYDNSTGTWTHLVGPQRGSRISKISAAAADPTNPNRLLIATNENPFHGYTSAASGVWMSVDGGTTWAMQNSGLGMLRGKSIHIAPDGTKAVFGTNGGGFYIANLLSSLKQETYSPAASNSSDTHRLFSDPDGSGGYCAVLEANATGDYVTYAIGDVQQRAYDVYVRFKYGSNRGNVQLAVAGSLNGTYTNHGSAQTLYSSALAYSNPIKVATITFGSAGTKYFRFTVTGKHASSSSYWASVDYIELIPK